MVFLLENDLYQPVRITIRDDHGARDWSGQDSPLGAAHKSNEEVSG